METPKYQSLHLTQSVDVYRDFLWGFARLTTDFYATNTMHLVASLGFPDSLVQNESFGFRLSGTYITVGFGFAMRTQACMWPICKNPVPVLTT